MSHIVYQLKSSLSRLTSLFLSSIDIRMSLKKPMIRFYKWRLVISMDRLVELSKAGIYSQELDTEIRPTGTDTNITKLN